MNSNKKLKIGIYIRLSLKNTDDLSVESNSIKGQRELIYKYIEDNIYEDYTVKEFIDDGFTGTTFNRPAIKNLLLEAKNSEINCIIVKDFSRFGRNFLEVGTYLDEIFPLLLVRFISINDNYDSFYESYHTIGINNAFKNIINDFYSKDLGRKIKSAITVKQIKGMYSKNNTPYGYTFINCNEVKINAETSLNVNKIFNLYDEGESIKKIAKILNDSNVLSPSEFKKQKSKVPIYDKKALWTVPTIRNILKNEFYIGNLVLNKTEKQQNFLGDRKRIDVLEEKRYRFINRHQPIISHEKFYNVSKKLEKK